MAKDALNRTKNKLIFKGGEKPIINFRKVKEKSRKAKHKKKRSKSIEKEVDLKQEQEASFKKIRGSGKILSSGTTIMGQMGTKFLTEVQSGDAIVIRQTNDLIQEETRIIKMVLSDVSISISTPFTSDLISLTSFHYIKAPKQESDTEKDNKDQSEYRRHMESEKGAFGTYAGGTSRGTEYTYRIKNASAYGGYTIVKEKTSKDMTREELLDIRQKRKGDRYCM